MKPNKDGYEEYEDDTWLTRERKRQLIFVLVVILCAIVVIGIIKMMGTSNANMPVDQSI